MGSDLSLFEENGEDVNYQHQGWDWCVCCFPPLIAAVHKLEHIFRRAGFGGRHFAGEHGREWSS